LWRKRGEHLGLLPLMGSSTTPSFVDHQQRRGFIEVGGEAVTSTCYAWQANGVMTTDCPMDQEGFASWSGSKATTSVYSLKAIPDPGYTFTGWNGCNVSGSDEFTSWNVYTSEDGTTCNLDHGGDYGSYRLQLAQRETLAAGTEALIRCRFSVVAVSVDGLCSVSDWRTRYSGASS